MTAFLVISALGLCLSYIFFQFSTRTKGGSEFTENKKRSPNPTLHKTAPNLVPGEPSLTQQRGQLYLDLYHKLHNLERFPGILPVAYHTLVSLLREGLLIERAQPGSRSILSIEKYNRPTLEAFLFEYQEEVYREWEKYNQRQISGQATELFKDKESAKEWLKQIAPLKFVDGAWLGYVHKISTPFALREITKNAWQVLSEELGDGELDKNHVYLYRRLLESVGLNLPASHTAEFIDPKTGIHNVEVWKSATAQLLISLFPNEFLPEILGFNLHYELITLETLKASKELPRVGISGYYFALHVSIDNADSGHTAMALATVDQYMSWAFRTGSINPEEAWKRIQAGYILASTVGKESPVLPAETRVIDILQRKAAASHRIHCTSRYRIGQKSLAEWLAPESWRENKFPDRDFLDTLAEAKPWIHRGDSKKSLLMRELSWKGKMFGAFTHSEVEEIRRWIDSLSMTASDDDQSYWSAVKRRGPPLSFHNPNTAIDGHLGFAPEVDIQGLPQASSHDWTPLPLELPKERVQDFLSIWFAHACLLEYMVATPYETATPIGSLVVRILRAEYGFGPETSGVAGVDEHTPRDYYPNLVTLGLVMMREQGLPDPTCLHDVLTGSRESASPAEKSAYDMLSWAIRPQRHGPFLIGLSHAFLDLESWLTKRSELLPAKESEALEQLVNRKRVCFDELVKELKLDKKDYDMFIGGCNFGRRQIIDKVLT